MSIHIRAINALSLLLLLFGGMMLVSCDRVIYDDLSECPQGVHFAFHYQTPCMSGPSYPADIKEVRIFAFDERGILTSEYSAKGLALSADYRLETNYHRVGTSTFVAWGGSDLSKYQFSQFEVGKTTKEEMMLSLKRQSKEVTADLPALYVGKPVGGALKQIDRSHLGTHFDLIDFQMQQLTNTVRLTVLGLQPEYKYEVYIEDDNSRYLIDGSFAGDSRFSYLSPNFEQKEGTLRADFTLIKLDYGRNARLVIRDVDHQRVVYEANLVEDLIGYRGEYYPETTEPPFSLACDHTFNIVIRLTDKYTPNTYVAFRVDINQWNMVRRVEILGK